MAETGHPKDAAWPPDLVASFFTLSGAGFTEPPRNSFIDRCEAAARAGFAGIGLHTGDLVRTVADGLDIGEMAAVLRVNGLQLIEIEFLGGWAFDVDEKALSETVAAVERVDDACGGRHVSTGEFRGLAGAGLELDSAAGRLGDIARRLDRRGLLLAVEPFPWSAVSTVGDAVELVRRSGAANVGLMVDMWHFVHCAGTPELLDALPAGTIAAVQLNDGPRVYQDFLTNARAHRHLPGEGDLDVIGLIRAVRRAGYTGPYCVESNTAEFRALPVREAASRAFDAATAVLVGAT